MQPRFNENLDLGLISDQINYYQFISPNPAIYRT